MGGLLGVCAKHFHELSAWMYSECSLKLISKRESTYFYLVPGGIIVNLNFVAFQIQMCIVDRFFFQSSGHLHFGSTYMGSHFGSKNTDAALPSSTRPGPSVVQCPTAFHGPVTVAPSTKAMGMGLGQNLGNFPKECRERPSQAVLWYELQTNCRVLGFYDP